MPLDERRDRYAAMMVRLRKFDVHAWCDGFLQALQRSRNVAAGASACAADAQAAWG